jgi:CrcB protein
MKDLLVVAAGGAVGAVTRYKLGGLVLHHTTHWKFPLSTFVVNVSGCLAAGVLAGLIVRHDAFGPDVRLFLFTGLLGGYTTFSAFGLETVFLLQRSEFLLAVVNVGLSALAGIGVLWLGMKVIP